jgi:hypothetical protein
MSYINKIDIFFRLIKLIYDNMNSKEYITIRFVRGIPESFQIEFEEGITIERLLLKMQFILKDGYFRIICNNEAVCKDKLVEKGDIYDIYDIYDNNYLKAWEDSDNLDIEEYDPEINIDGDQYWD